MLLRWAYILVGNNNTGKTTFQRNLVAELCGQDYGRLPSNVVNTITRPQAPRTLQTVFTCGRSYQERLDEYKSVANYFEEYFKDADVCFLSSHAHGDSQQHVEEIIDELARRCYNIAGVFWSNSFDSDASRISQLHWQKRVWIDNPKLDDQNRVPEQLTRVTRAFVDLLLQRCLAY